MEEKAADKLDGIQRHEFGLVAMGRISPAESDAAILHRHQAPVGNGNPVGVAGQILEDLLGSAKWTLGMDHPLLVFEFSKEAVEFRRLPKPGERAGKAQFLLAIGAAEQSQKGAAEAGAPMGHSNEGKKLDSWDARPIARLEMGRGEYGRI